MSLSANPIKGTLCVGLCAAIFTGCSGGGSGGGTSAMPPQQNPVLAAQSSKAAKGNVSFSIGITPKTKAGRITPKYVSASTQSLQILTDGTNGAFPVVINLTPSSPNCSPNPKVPGSYICTASLTVPAGNHIFTVTAYDLTGAQGNVLSTNSTGTVSVKPIGTTQISIVLEGVVHYVILTLAAPYPALDKAAAIGLTAILQDADHNLIIGTAPYEYPVTLTTTDAANGPLSKTTLKSPADTAGLTVNYNGANASITYSAVATGLPAANVTNAALTGIPANQAATRLYVAGPSNGSVNVYDLAHSNAPLPPISLGGLTVSGRIAIGANGKLYVPTGSVISVFDTANGNKALSPISGGFSSLAIDADGKLYALNSQLYPAVIIVFDTRYGNYEAAEIRSNELIAPRAEAIDASGKLYVLRGGWCVGRGCAYPAVSVFDTRNGNAALQAFAPGGNYPLDIATDATGKLYEADYASGVHGYDTLHGYDQLPLAYGPYDAVAVQADLSGRLYVGVVNEPQEQDIHVDVTYPALANTKLSTIPAAGPAFSYIAVH